MTKDGFRVESQYKIFWQNLVATFCPLYPCEKGTKCGDQVLSKIFVLWFYSRKPLGSPQESFGMPLKTPRKPQEYPSDSAVIIKEPPGIPEESHKSTSGIAQEYLNLSYNVFPQIVSSETILFWI